MLELIFPILADSDDGIAKILIFIVVLVIWGIGALVKMSAKQGQAARHQQSEIERAMREQMEEARRRAAQARGQTTGQPLPPPLPRLPHAQRQQVPRSHGGPTSAVPPMRTIGTPSAQPAMRRPMAPVGPMQQPQHRPVKKAQRRQAAPQQQKRRAPAVPVVAEVEEVPNVVLSEIGAGAVPASPARRERAEARRALSGMRLNAQTLRQQFILTELLQPPLALRDSRPNE